MNAWFLDSKLSTCLTVVEINSYYETKGQPSFKCFIPPQALCTNVKMLPSMKVTAITELLLSFMMCFVIKATFLLVAKAIHNTKRCRTWLPSYVLRVHFL